MPTDWEGYEKRRRNRRMKYGAAILFCLIFMVYLIWLAAAL